MHVELQRVGKWSLEQMFFKCFSPHSKRDQTTT